MVGEKLFKMVVNVKKLLKMVKKMVIFQNLSKNGEMLKNVGKNIKKFYCTDHLLHSGY